MNEEELRALLGDFWFDESKRIEATVTPDASPPPYWTNDERTEATENLK